MNYYSIEDSLKSFIVNLMYNVFNVHEFLKNRISKSAPLWPKKVPSNTKRSLYWPCYKCTYYLYLRAITISIIIASILKLPIIITLKHVIVITLSTSLWLSALHSYSQPFILALNPWLLVSALHSGSQHFTLTLSPSLWLSTLDS